MSRGEGVGSAAAEAVARRNYSLNCTHHLYEF